MARATERQRKPSERQGRSPIRTECLANATAAAGVRLDVTRAWCARCHRQIGTRACHCWWPQWAMGHVCGDPDWWDTCGHAKQTPCPPRCAEACSFCKDGRCDLPADHEETKCIEWHSCGCFSPEDAKSTSGLIAARGGVDTSVLGQRFQDAGRHGLAL